MGNPEPVFSSLLPFLLLQPRLPVTRLADSVEGGILNERKGLPRKAALQRRIQHSADSLLFVIPFMFHGFTPDGDICRARGGKQMGGGAKSSADVFLFKLHGGAHLKHLEGTLSGVSLCCTFQRKFESSNKFYLSLNLLAKTEKKTHNPPPPSPNSLNQDC